MARGLNIVSCGLTEVVGITIGGTLTGLRIPRALAHDANDLSRGYLCITAVGGRICSGRGDMEEWETMGTGRDISRDFVGRHSSESLDRS